MAAVTTERLLASFGFEAPPITAEPPRKTARSHARRGWRAKDHTTRSPKWELPLFQTLKVTRLYFTDGTDIPVKMPPRWTEIKQLAEVGAHDEYDSDPLWRCSAAMIDYRDAYVQSAQAAVRKNLVQFCRRYFDIELMPFHLELLEMCFRGGKYVCMLPTEHGKSTLLCVIYPLLGLMENPDDAYTICCNNLPEAKNRLRAIKNHLEGNVELIRDFPWLARTYEGHRSATWGATELTVGGRRDMTKLSPSIYACGKGDSSIKGRRAKTIHDDLEGKTARERPDERRQLREWFMTEAIRTIESEEEEDRPLIMVAGTPFDVDSFFFFLARKPGWVVYKRPYKHDDGRLIWPSRESKIRDFKASFTRLEFAIAMSMDPTGGDPDILSMEDIARLSAEGRPMPADAGLLVTLDPAGGAGRDYAGIAVVRYFWAAQDELPMFNVRSPRMFEKGIIEQIRECQQLAHKYAIGGKPAKVIFEVNGRQKQDYTAMFRSFAPEIELLRHWTSEENKMDKTHGFTVIKTMLREGRLAILSDGSDKDEDGKRQLHAEIRDLGTSKDDHIVAALWFVFAHIYGKHRWLRKAQQRVVYDGEGRDNVRMVAGQVRRVASGQALYFGGRPAFGAQPRRFNS